MVQNSTVPNVHGSYDVKEAFTEWQVPLLKELPAIDRLNLLAAARYAKYEGSGGVWSWKYGLDWDVVQDLRLRGTVSRDVRAATLTERYNQTGGVGSVSRDPVFPNDGTQTFSSRTGGNPFLDPETSKTYTYGVVYQPGWLQGLLRARWTTGRSTSPAPSARWGSSASSMTASIPAALPASAA